MLAWRAQSGPLKWEAGSFEQMLVNIAQGWRRLLGEVQHPGPCTPAGEAAGAGWVASIRSYFKGGTDAIC